MTATAKSKAKIFFSKRSNLVYTAFGVLSFLIFLFLAIWSMLGTSSGDSLVLPARIERAEGFRTEYLVGEKFSTDGLKLNIGSERNPKYVDISECSIDVDFSSAGNKSVSVSYEAGENKKYVATFGVHVCFVRSFTVRTLPSDIRIEEGKAVFSEDFFMTAELGETPSSAFERYAEGQRNEIVVGKEMYSFTARTDGTVEGYYEGEILCGKIKKPLNFYLAAGRTFIVSSKNSILPYDRESGSGALTLVITDVGKTYSRCVGKTAGYYIYEQGANCEVLDFAYELTERAELLTSQGVSENETDYSVSYKGSRFTVSANKFQSAVVGGAVVNEGGYNVVVDDVSKRIMRATADNGATLTLYITEHVFATTGYGDAYGYYIFKSPSGNYYKADFICHSFGWEYVPWPVNEGEKYEMRSDGTLILNDYFLQGQSYGGPMHADVVVQDGEPVYDYANECWIDSVESYAFEFHSLDGIR